MSAAVRRLRAIIGDEAESRWGLPANAALALFWLPIVGALVVVLSRAWKPLFRFLTGEDRLLEWGQFALYAAAAILAFMCAVRLLRSHRPWWGLLYLVFGVILVFIAGEEIAWGEQVFHYEGAEFIERSNEQDEQTIHNIGNGVNDVFAAGLALAGLYGAVLPWLERARPSGLSDSTRRLFVPPLCLTAAFAMVFVYRVSRWAVFHEDHFTIVEFQEWPEFCFALALGTANLLNYRLLRISATSRVAKPTEVDP